MQMQTQSQPQQRRYGNRATISQPAVLSINGKNVAGILENVGLRGAFFVADELPADGVGKLRQQGGRGVVVRIVWKCQESSGVGLRFQ